MTIWYVLESYWESDGVVAAFSSEQDAENYAAERTRQEEARGHAVPSFTAHAIVVDECLAHAP